LVEFSFENNVKHILSFKAKGKKYIKLLEMH